MSKENKLRWAVTFVINKTLAQEFIQWMEEIHIPNIHKTGLFEPLYRKIQEVKDAHVVVQYIHTPKSEKDWKDYNNGPRPKLRNEFEEEWGGAKQSGDLSAVMLCGQLIECSTAN